MKSRLAALVLLVPLGIFALNGCASAGISNLGDDVVATNASDDDDAKDPVDTDDPDTDDSGDDDEPTLPTTGPLGSDDDDYPAQVRTNYLTSCEAVGTDMEDYCACTLDELESAYTLEEFTELEKKVTAGDAEATKAITDVAAVCIDKVG